LLRGSEVGEVAPTAAMREDAMIESLLFLAFWLAHGVVVLLLAHRPGLWALVQRDDTNWTHWLQ
jgi:hypothetical protein